MAVGVSSTGASSGLGDLASTVGDEGVSPSVDSELQPAAKHTSSEAVSAQ